MRRLSILLFCLPAVLLGCATAGTSGNPNSSESPRLTRAEIVDANLPTAYDLVDRLRRPWLRRDALTGNPVAIYMDNQNIGDAQKLRDIPAVDVAELLYLPNGEAVKRFGSQVTGSVIVITRQR